jgi:hypothetical protein
MSIALLFYYEAGQMTSICNKYFGLPAETSLNFVRTGNFLVNSAQEHSMSIIIHCSASVNKSCVYTAVSIRHKSHLVLMNREVSVSHNYHDAAC